MLLFCCFLTEAKLWMMVVFMDKTEHKRLFLWLWILFNGGISHASMKFQWADSCVSETIMLAFSWNLKQILEISCNDDNFHGFFFSHTCNCDLISRLQWCQKAKKDSCVILASLTWLSWSNSYSCDMHN